MQLNANEILSTIRQVIVDYEFGPRLGLAWTDEQILRTFTTYYNETLQELAHKGVTHAIASHVEYLVCGPNTLGVVVGGAPGPVAMALPPECIYVLSVGWNGLNVPVYHIAEIEPTADSLLEGSKEPVALFIPSGPTLRLTVDFSSSVSLPEHLIVAYLRKLPDFWWIPSPQYPYPTSRLVYWAVLAKTLVHLIEPDSGYLKVPYSPSFAPIEQISMIGNRMAILQANGRLRYLRPMEAR